MNLAFLPARLMGRWRSDIAESVAVDTERFAAGPRWALPALVALAVLYPVAASVAHAVGPHTPGGDALALALRPFFDIVFAESLPFMIATAGIGLMSPGLGVLFILFFIPADLIAAAYSNLELINQPWSAWPGAWFARPASWLLLWVLAVEIPLRVRQFTVDWAFSRSAEPRPIFSAAVQMAATAVPVAAWAFTVPWLVKPIYTWTMIQTVLSWATAPTWYYWWILVIGATVLGGLAAVFPSSLTSAAAAVAWAGSQRGPDAPRSATAVALRQLVTVALLALLLIGLMSTVVEGVLIVLGLILAGPVLTLLLKGIRVPGMLARASREVRWVAAVGMALGLSLAIFLLAGPDKFAADYLVLAVDFAIVAPLFRVILEAGTDEVRIESPAGAKAPPAMITSALLALALALWLGLPAVVLADDCSDTSGDELPSCVGAGAGAAAGAAVAGAAAAGAALKRKNNRKASGPPPGWPEQKPPPGSEPPPDGDLADYDKQQADKSSFTRGPSDRFKNIKKGTGEYFDKK